MTREETIVNLEKLIALFHTASEQSKMIDYSKIIETLEFAAAALRPVSREQVEKVWRGEWIDCSNGWMCSRCEHDNTYAKLFCPSCGAAMTDEAVDMVMERMEALHEDNSCSWGFRTNELRNIYSQIPNR